MQSGAVLRRDAGVLSERLSHLCDRFDPQSLVQIHSSGQHQEPSQTRITQGRRGYYDKGRGNCGTVDSQADHADVAVSAVSTRESKSRHARTQGRCGGCSGRGERTHGNSHWRSRVYANERLCVGSSMGLRDLIWRGTRGFYYHSRLANAARALRERG